MFAEVDVQRFAAVIRVPNRRGFWHASVCNMKPGILTFEGIVWRTRKDIPVGLAKHFIKDSASKVLVINM